MKERKVIPKKVIDELLVKSKRRCPLCVETGDTEPKMGDIAHLVPLHEGATNLLDNLVFLCPHHHAAFDRGGSNAPSVDDVRSARDALYKAIERESAAALSDKPRIFVIHGPDLTPKMELIRFLESIGIEAVVLSELPTFGKTVLEKLEDNANVTYAIAILTPDDMGTRARQNVVFELGYLMGKLGSRNVCALVKSGVEIPSDFHGTLYIDMDSERKWQDLLRRELSYSGFKVSID